MRPFRPLTPQAIVIVDDAAYASILRRQRDDGDFSRFDLRRASERNERFGAAYYAECFRAFGLLPAYAERLKPYLAPSLRVARPEGEIRVWQTIANHLKDKGILILPKPIPSDALVEFVNEPALEPWSMPQAIHVDHHDPADKPYQKIRSSDERNQLRLAVQLAATWLDEGVPPERITIANVAEEERFLIKTLARRYGFDVAQKRRTPLIQLPSVARFWQRIDRENPDETLQDMFPDPSDPIRAALQEILDIYADFPERALFWRFELEQRCIEEPRLTHAVRLAAWDDLNEFDDSLTIVINALEGMFPPLRQDDRLCPDEWCPLLGLRTSIEENERRRRRVKQVIESIENLVLITPSKRGGSPVVPLDDARFGRGHEVLVPHHEWLARSQKDARFLFGALAHEQKTYGTTSPLYPVLEASLPPRRPYDPRFKGIDRRTADSLKPIPLVLSATSLEVFFACRFRYLLTHLLQMEAKKPSFSASLGTAVHRRLENLKNDFGPLELQSPEFGPSRLRAFEIAVDRRLKRVIEHLLHHLDQTAFADAGTEKAFTTPIDDAGNYVLKGRIDRIMTYRFDDRDYVAVIDYKTGNATFSKDDFEQGTDLQLIVYWELLRHQPTHRNAGLAGFFYQPVALGRLLETDGTDDFGKRMKMNGYVVDDSEVAKAFDSGGFIRGLQFKNDGSFHARVKRFDQDQLDRWLTRLQTHLQNAVAQIEDGDYHITPIAKKPGASESVSCTHCPFAGICYMANNKTEEDTEATDDGEDEAWAD